jgi:hypothetical protein
MKRGVITSLVALALTTCSFSGCVKGVKSLNRDGFAVQEIQNFNYEIVDVNGDEVSDMFVRKDKSEYESIIVAEEYLLANDNKLPSGFKAHKNAISVPQETFDAFSGLIRMDLGNARKHFGIVFNKLYGVKSYEVATK